MPKRVVVEPHLKKIREHLQNSGFEVTALDQCCHPTEAVIYSGPRVESAIRRLAAPQNTALLNAEGMTPEEVVQHLEDELI